MIEDNKKIYCKKAVKKINSPGYFKAMAGNLTIILNILRILIQQINQFWNDYGGELEDIKNDLICLDDKLKKEKRKIDKY